MRIIKFSDWRTSCLTQPTRPMTSPRRPCSATSPPLCSSIWRCSCWIPLIKMRWRSPRTCSSPSPGEITGCASPSSRSRTPTGSWTSGGSNTSGDPTVSLRMQRKLTSRYFFSSKFLQGRYAADDQSWSKPVINVDKWERFTFKKQYCRWDCWYLITSLDTIFMFGWYVHVNSNDNYDEFNSQ